MKVLAVIDMQRDFIDGALGTKEAVSIVPAVRRKIEAARKEGTLVVFTRDSHREDYLATQEGRNLPVEHCLVGTDGWQISPELDVDNAPVFDKPGFGSAELVQFLSMLPKLESVELVGLCTDICVITNAMMIKGALPELPVAVDSACCAGVTPESHRTALAAMKMCQIKIV
jgi:nicotinamidase/pyrazinamidase